MSAPTPYVTDPFHSLNSIFNYYSNFHIYIKECSGYFLQLVLSSVSLYGADLAIMARTLAETPICSFACF